MMTDQEALLRWLRIAWDKGMQMEQLAEALGQANTTLDLQEAERRLRAPFPPRHTVYRGTFVGRI